MKFEFSKLHGSGNDFILVNNFNQTYNNWNPDLVRKICSRHTGIGADGLIVLEQDNLSDFFMRFFNADGFESTMCANGSRCICKFAYDLGVVSKEFQFRAKDGLHNGIIIDETTVRVQINLHDEFSNNNFKHLSLPDFLQFKGFLNTGVPHLVVETLDVDNIDVFKLGKELRYHPAFGPDGTNVNFVEVLDKQKKLKIRTYERGVEDETLSCGTGVTACAVVYTQQAGKESSEFELITKGGTLKVDISENFKIIYLQGPVARVFNGSYF